MQAARWSRVAGALIALAAAPAGQAVAQDVTLRAATASGGVVKAERSAPLHVSIDSAHSTFAGELRVSWGDVRLRRHVSLPSPGRRTFELHVRTADPEATIRVELVAQNRSVQIVDVPVRVLPPDAPVLLCVMSSDGSTADAGCTATTFPDLLPRSLRGYEAIDRVAWPAGDSNLSAVQRAAFEQWRALRGLEQSGAFGLAPQPARPAFRRGLPTWAARGVAVVTAGYIAGLIAVGFLTIHRRVSLGPMWLAVTAVMAAAAGAVHAIGRAGPGSTIRVHHDSVLHQIPGTDASVLSMRAVAEFPALDRYVLRLPLNDAAIDPASARGRPEQVVDENGLAVIDGRYGLGSRQAFAAEGTLAGQPLAIAQTGRAWTIQNRSQVTLKECRFADGFSSTEARALRPGASSTGHQASDVPGPVFTCRADDPLVVLSSEEHPVETQGVTLIAVYESRLDRREPGVDD